MLGLDVSHGEAFADAMAIAAGGHVAGQSAIAVDRFTTEGIGAVGVDHKGGDALARALFRARLRGLSGR